LSSQKNKFLASAQKYIQKGQFDRALRDYEQVVTADPKDVKHRQKLAELLVRCNRREDAIREYDTIARFYDENGFNLKSIAVYKQIQRLDPSNIEISLSLAALNEKQGMIGNALSEYKTVFDHYEKNGRTDDALKILEKMHAVDPDNVDIRLKLAETFFTVGSNDKSYQEYTRAAMALKERGMTALFEKVYGRIRELFPDKTDSSLDILVEQVRSGAVDDAIPKLRRLLGDDPDNLRVLVLLADAYRISGDVKGRKETLRRVIDVSPEDLSAIKGLIECFVGENDLEASLALIDKYSPALFSAGAYGEIEQYYTALQNVDPYDVRLLEGLYRLYELTGEKSKLADIQVSLNILSQKDKGGSEPESEAPREEHLDIETLALSSVGETSSSTDVAWGDEIDLTKAADIELSALSSAGEASSSTDSAWGDEIDLSNAADIASGSQGEARDTDTGDFAVVDLTPGQSDAGEAVSDEFEIDISFELPEDADLFAAPQAEDGKEISTSEQERTGPTLLDLAETDVSAEDVGFIEEIAIDAEIAPHVPYPVGEDRHDDRDWEESPVPSNLEPQIDISRSFEEPTPVVTIEAAAGSPTFPEAETISPVGAAEDTLAPEAFEQEDILFGFKESLDQQLEQEDAETHYNLGIAYMEMGLHDDAIKQFRISANDPNRELDCLTLQGVCCREKGDFAGSEQVLTSVLSLADLGADRIMNLRYELGLLYMAAGRGEEALQAFRDVFAVNPGFRDTMRMIAQLSGKAGNLDLSDMDDVEIELEEID
jgi:pentatricopeptide repeat protein